MTDPMIEFVLACIAEREKAAEAATPGSWTVDPDGLGGANIVGDDDQWVTETMHDVARTDAIHMALNDPARVLARCAADRKLVELHRCAGSYPLGDDDGPRRSYCNTCGSGEPYEYPKPWPCETLRLLANANADHPDFRPEWKL